MQSEDVILLRQMHNAGASALRFSEGRDPGDLYRSEMWLFTLLRAAQVIGDAAIKMSIDRRSACTNARRPIIISLRSLL